MGVTTYESQSPSALGCTGGQGDCWLVTCTLGLLATAYTTACWTVGRPTVVPWWTGADTALACAGQLDAGCVPVPAQALIEYIEPATWTELLERMHDGTAVHAAGRYGYRQQLLEACVLPYASR